jgi:cytochrome c-type biogenesis protein CcmH
MTIFWIFVAGLIGLALLFVLPPMLTRHGSEENVDGNEVNLAVFRQQMEELDADLASGNLEQSQYEAARRDLEKELLADIDDKAAADSPGGSGRWAAGLLAVALPAMSLGMYLQLGDHQAVERPTALPPPSAEAPGHSGEELPPMEVLVQRLAERMEADPGNLEGWVMLGRSYTAMGEQAKAIDAFQRASELAPDDPAVMLGLAESMARTAGKLQGRPEQLIDAVLELEPGNINGLFMKGMARYQQDDMEGALQLWNRVQGLLEPGSEDVAALQQYIAQARQRAGLPPETPPVAVAAADPADTSPARETPAPTAADSGKTLTVQVDLAPGMADKFAPEDTLFVFARAASGPPMPLAVRRLQARDLPVTLSLDDSLAMMPQMRLSNFDQVVVGARISKTGNAIPQSGDLQAEVVPATPGQASVVSVLIDSIRP